MRALHLFESSTCPGCGFSLIESGDLSNMGEFTTSETRCLSCEALDKEHKKHPDGVPPYLKIAATKRPPRS